MAVASESKVEVSVIMPLHNAALYLSDALASLYAQTFSKAMELSVYDDRSSDDSAVILSQWVDRLESRGVHVVQSKNNCPKCCAGDDLSCTNNGKLSPSTTRREEESAKVADARKRLREGNTKHGDDVLASQLCWSDYLCSECGRGRGCGYAKNCAVRQSQGRYLCFFDADDVMEPERVRLQFECAEEHPGALVGCNIQRIPEGATKRYTDWVNKMNHEQLHIQQYREVTVIQPTWFISRRAFEEVGYFDEGYPNVPEDMVFFHQFLQHGGRLVKVPRCLLRYRYHDANASSKIHRKRLQELKVRHMEATILKEWKSFYIWGAGRDARNILLALRVENQKKVRGFVDIQGRKGEYMNCWTLVKVPYVTVADMQPQVPFVVAVVLDRYEGADDRIQELGLTEGRDYVRFC